MLKNIKNMLKDENAGPMMMIPMCCLLPCLSCCCFPWAPYVTAIIVRLLPSTNFNINMYI